jgi:hypothetical protein
MQDLLLLSADTSSESSDMTTGMTQEQRLCSLESRADNTKEQIGKLAQDVGSIAVTLREIQTDLK